MAHARQLAVEAQLERHSRVLAAQVGRDHAVQTSQVVNSALKQIE